MLLARKKTILLFCCILFCFGQDAFSQKPNPKPFRLNESAPTSFTLAFGYATLQGHDGLRELWSGGLGGSAAFQVHLSRVFSVGMGTDLSLLYFDEYTFARRWPGVTLKKKQNLFMANVHLDGTYEFLPSRQTRPYLSAQVGGQVISKALFREVINGVRHTYYEVGGKPRLTFGLAAGANISLNYALGLVVELKGMFIHNDPAVNILALGRAGLQFKL